jgi:hypothetical protein
VHGKRLPVDCPDNDKHNVDTIDGLVLPSITALAAAARGQSSAQQMATAARAVAVTRNSPVVSARVLCGSWLQSDLFLGALLVVGVFNEIIRETEIFTWLKTRVF